MDNMEGEDDKTAKARLLSASGRTAGMWLQASEQAAIEMDDETFRKAVWWIIGMPQAHEGAICQLQPTEPHYHIVQACTATLDVTGIHAIACKWGRATTQMHDTIANIIHEAMLSAGLHPIRGKVIPEWARWYKADKKKKSARCKVVVPRDGHVGAVPPITKEQELNKWQCAEAIIDIEGKTPEGSRLLVDVTHRCPTVARYIQNKKCKPGQEHRCAARTA